MKRTHTRHLDADETVSSDWPLPKRLWRQCLTHVFCFPDRGMFGLTPLRTHVLICGYPRSGSTMLQLMLEHAYPHARRFRRETRGYRAAMFSFRNHECMISKQPGDILRLQRLKNHYAGQAACLRPIVMIRDPRDVLTSRHANWPDREYFLDVDKWREYDKSVKRHQRESDVLLFRYEDLVADVEATQKTLEEFIREPMQRPLSTFHAQKRTDFRDLQALNGLRPVDRKGVGRWRDPKHVRCIEQILTEFPGFPQRLIELGYETDRGWTERYMQIGTRSAA